MGIYEGWTKTDKPAIDPMGQLNRIRAMAEELKLLDPAKYQDARMHALQDVLDWDGIETYLNQELQGLDASAEAQQNSFLRMGGY